MKTAIECIYKGIKETKAGSFVNSNGQTINYNGSYKIVFDQLIKGLPKETELKIPKEIAINLIPNLKAYDRVVLNLDITIYSNHKFAIKIVSIEKK